MRVKSTREIAAASLEHARHSRDHASPDDEPNWWAFELMLDLERNDPERTWLVILDMVALAQDNRDVVNIAAGPMEDLLGFHGPQFIERVEDRARADRTFERMLSGVWRFTIDEAVWQRLQQLIDPTNHVDADGADEWRPVRSN
jgi:hypothetical protein